MSKELTAIALCKNDFIRARTDETTSALLGRFLKTNQNYALVFGANNHYVGITTKEGLLKKHVDFSTLKLKSLVKKKPVLFGDDSLSKIAELMFSTEARILPVFEHKKLLGAVSAREVVKQITVIQSLKNLPVKEVATIPAKTVLETTSLGKTLSVMHAEKINRVPLVSQNGTLTGLFSFSDFLRNVAFHTQQKPRGHFRRKKEDIERTSVLDAPIKMFSSANPIVVLSHDSLDKVLQKMCQKNISSLLVVQNQKPIGIVTMRDLLRLLIQSPFNTQNIRFVNKPVLDEVDAPIFDQTISDAFDKIARRVSTLSLSIHFKDQRVTGARKKHLIRVHAIAPGMNLVASAQGWNLLKVLQEVLRALQSEVRKKRK